MHHVAGLALPLVVASALVNPVAGQDEPQAESAPLTPNLADLLERIERLEGDKVQMQDEIAELRAHNGDTWLTEERANQVRLLVEDVLTDADTRSSLLQDGATAGWDGQFFVASADGRFRLNVGGQMQFRWIWNYHDQAPTYVYGFENTRTKLVFSGHVFSPDLTFKIQGDFGAQTTLPPASAGPNVLQDAWIRWMLNSDWSLRFGQFKLPYNREFLVDSMYQQVIGRSLVSERGNIGRSPGIELTYGGRHNTVSVALSNGGDFNVAPGVGAISIPNVPANSPALSSSTEYSITARYQRKFAGTWDQFRQLTSPPGEAFALLWGIAGHYQRNDPKTSGVGVRDHTTWLAATTDISAQWGGANLFSSFTYNYFDVPGFNVNTFGWTLQGGIYFTEKLEGYARVEWGRFIIDSDPFQKDLAAVTVGGNYYLDGQDLKLSADIGFGLNPVSGFWNSNYVGWRADGEDVRPQIVVRTQFQLLF